MKKILFVNHKDEKCGVYQYGVNVYNAVKLLKDFYFVYAECSNTDQLTQSINTYCPDGIIYNYHKCTMPFIDGEYLNQISHSIHICLAHELDQKEIDQIDGTFFNYYIFADPTFTEGNPFVFKINRLLFPYENHFSEPEVPIIGSYGFGFQTKGYKMLIKIVEKEFDLAIIKINIAPHSIFDQYGYGARELAKQLVKLVKKPNIKLDITHHFFSQEQLLDFLAMNSINVFMYDPIAYISSRGGISSAVDQAIAVKRPIAITNNSLSRHLFSIKPSILVKHCDLNFLYRIARRIVGCCIRGDFKYLLQLIHLVSRYPFLKFNSLKTILQNGTSPIQNLYSEWSIEKFQKDFMKIIDSIFSEYQKNSK